MKAANNPQTSTESTDSSFLKTEHLCDPANTMADFVPATPEQDKNEQSQHVGEIRFDLSNALNNLSLHGISIPQRFTKTPAVSPVKPRRRLNSMNGDCYGSGDDESLSTTSSPPSLLEMLSPSSVSSSSSSFTQVFDDLDSVCCAKEDTSSSIPCFLPVIQTTILEEAVEMSLPDDTQHEASINSSILVCEEETSTPAKIEYCGIIWPCCHSTSNVLVDDGLHAKICKSLGMEHWSCWQATYQASPGQLGVQRSYHRGQKKLDSLRRTLMPIEPRKATSFSPLLKINDSFASCESGYESDPQAHLFSNKTVSAPTLTLRATTVDELFNERLRLVLHTPESSNIVTFWLERGMVGLAVPPQICWHDGTTRTSIPLLDITKILSGHSNPTIPASPQRCFRICIGDEFHYTLEAPTLPMRNDLTDLLKRSVASLAAAVLTHGNIDVFFVRKEAWI